MTALTLDQLSSVDYVNGLSLRAGFPVASAALPAAASGEAGIAQRS
jgi:hypothetical protein